MAIAGHQPSRRHRTVEVAVTAPQIPYFCTLAGAAFLVAGFLEMVPLTLAATVGRKLRPIAHDTPLPTPTLLESL